MGTPADYLPPELSARSITELVETLGLPAPGTIEPFKVTAEYHSIYLLRYDGENARDIPARADPDGSVTLVLRVSGHHLPRIKTLNEVGVMIWVRENTSIPVPSVLHFSEREDNPIGYEFTLMEKAPGTSVDKVYDSLTEEDKKRLVEQLVEFLTELHSKSWTPGVVGGLLLQHNGMISPGPPLEETFWQLPDIEKYWPGETITSLNPLGDPPSPFGSYTSYTAAALDRYSHAIASHPSLSRFRTLQPAIRRFASVITSDRYRPRLDDVPYVLAHKDLHFANIMCDLSGPRSPAGAVRITAVLDWEFSGVVSATRWNPARAFLWNGRRGGAAKEEQARMERLFERVCVEKGVGALLRETRPSELQEKMQTAVNHIRAIVEVCPRGQAGDKVEGWRRVAEAAMEAFP